MKACFFLAIFLTTLFANAEDTSGWATSPATPNADKLAFLTANVSERGPIEFGDFDETGGDVTPEEASRSLGCAVPFEPGPSLLRTGPMGNEADVITPEIQALASGLRNDPLKIFEYVRNNIDFECYYGSKKGAHLTLLEGSGNDMDQAALFVALLRAGGHSASYAHGPCIFPLAAYRDWWGISATPYTHLTDPEVITMVGGLIDTSPANVNLWRARYSVMSAAKGAGYYNAEPFSVGGIECVSIPYTFVEFTWEGSTYNLSPAFKAYTRTSGIDLVAATQYNRTNFLAAAGGSTGTPDYVSGLSESGISNLLTTYTNNLISALRSGNNHGKSVDQLVGGRKINYQIYNSFWEVSQMIPTPEQPGGRWITRISFVQNGCPSLRLLQASPAHIIPLQTPFQELPFTAGRLPCRPYKAKNCHFRFRGPAATPRASV
jgi:hypothetical protein